VKSSPGTAAPIGDHRARAGTRRRAVIGVTAAIAALLTVTGCAAGQVAQTAEEVPVIDGYYATVGAIALRGVAVAAPAQTNWAKGSDAPLQLIIANSGTSDDTLTSISTSVASAVQIRDSGAAPCSGATPGSVFNSASGSTSAGSATESSSASSSPASSSPASSSPASGGSAASGTPTGSVVGTSAAGAPASCSNSVGAIPIKAGLAVSIGYSAGDRQIILQGLTQDLYPGQPIHLTFTFANAGPVNITIAVRLSTASLSPSIIPGLTGVD
jgi:copper(I)-binding protein